MRTVIVVATVSERGETACAAVVGQLWGSCASLHTLDPRLRFAMRHPINVVIIGLARALGAGL